MSERLKILVSAYACSPRRGSEPAVGWGFVSELARHHELWVIVEEEKFRADIEQYLAEHPGFAENVHFHFIAKQRNRRLRKLWPPSYYWYYRRWQEKAYALAERLHREVGFDIVHQLTMVGFREPGYLWRLDVPFVWGPVGGMGLFPWRFLPALGLYGCVYYLGYNLFNLWQMRFSGRPRLAAARAGAGLIAATPENRAGAKRFWGVGNAELICEVGLPPLAAVTPARRAEGTPLRLVWTGQHTPGKALNLALDALARLPATVEWQLDVLGHGKMTDAWRAQAENLGIAGRCAFHGWQPRDQALSIMQSNQVLVITSLRDLTSTVTIEALTMGLPIICLDHCGFAGVVDDSCGIKVPVRHPEQVIADLAVAIESLAQDEARRHALALGALAKAAGFTWQSKVEQLGRIYAQKHAVRGAG